MKGTAIPEGFRYIEVFLAESEQAELLRFCRSLELAPFTYQGRESNRRVKNFGVNFDYERKVPFLDTPIPEEPRWLLERVAGELGRPASDLKELLVTEYSPGAGINWHRDSRPFETVVGVSLGSGSPLQLRPVARKGDPSPITTLEVAAGSMYVLDGAARSAWMHRVPPVKTERWSLTIRSLRPQFDITAGTDG